MSKKSALMVYQNLKNITEEKEYWDKYIKFHELYWDGPNASQNVFYGNEYEEYRSSLSKYLHSSSKSFSPSSQSSSLSKKIIK